MFVTSDRRVNDRRVHPSRLRSFDRRRAPATAESARRRGRAPARAAPSSAVQHAADDAADDRACHIGAAVVGLPQGTRAFDLCGQRLVEPVEILGRDPVGVVGDALRSLRARERRVGIAGDLGARELELALRLNQASPASLPTPPRRVVMKSDARPTDMRADCIAASRTARRRATRSPSSRAPATILSAAALACVAFW